MNFLPTQPILLRLRDKAHCAFKSAQNDPAGNTIYDGALWMKTEGDEDELDIFAGRTTIVASKRPSPSPAHLSAEPLPQHTDRFSLITPPTTIPIAPIPDTNGNGVALTDAWPVSASSAPHAHTPSPFSSQSSQSAHQSMHSHPQQQHPYRLSFSQPPPPPQPQPGLSNYQPQPQWVGQHSPTSLTPPAAPYGTGLSTHPYGGGTSFQGEDLLQRYASASAYQQPHSHSQHVHPQQQHPHSQHARAHPGPQPTSQHYAPPPELVNLGLASRHGRLDERWTSFMHENGFL